MGRVGRRLGVDGATVVVVQWRRLAVILAAEQTENGEHGEVDEQFVEHNCFIE